MPIAGVAAYVRLMEEEKIPTRKDSQFAVIPEDLYDGGSKNKVVIVCKD